MNVKVVSYKEGAKALPSKIKWDDYFYYDETSPSGLRWKVDIYIGRYLNRRIVCKGDVAGSSKSKRYWVVRLKSRGYLCHRIVFEMHNGAINEGSEIDHINGDRYCNKVSNLRLVDTKVNARNRNKHCGNTSNATGVHFCIGTKSDGMNFPLWRAKWRHLDGTDKTKSFSILKYGLLPAFAMACAHRELKIKELNEIGAGYTERHGK